MGSEKEGMLDFDIMIKGGKIIDGTGGPAYPSDIGIRDGVIVAMGDLSSLPARRLIDAMGKTVCPGFIDVHTHSDLALLVDPLHAAGLSQGITTEILGQDGLSYAPLSRENLRTFAWYLGGLNGYPGIDWDWSSVAEFREKFDRTVAVNTAYQVPHGAIRLEAVGFQDVPMVGDDLKRAQRELAQGFDQGAVAFSTGLSYYPNSWSTTDELVGLCRVAAGYGRPFVIHTRTVWRSPREDWSKMATSEALEIGRRSGVAVHFSHFRTGPSNAGRITEMMEPIDTAVMEGMDITLDIYPYPSGSGYLMFFLPPWSHEGGPQALMRRLSDEGTRRRIAQGMRENVVPPSSDDVITFVGSSKNAWAMGRSFRDVAETMGLSDISEALLVLMLEENLLVGYRGSPSSDQAVLEQLDQDFLELISRPNYMVGSDSIHVGSSPHPRTFGTFTRFIRLARERGSPSLETLINRMTLVPAKRFGLHDRGVLAEGKAADIVVFDPGAVCEQATYANPAQQSVGIEYVLVNGQIAWENGRPTGVTPGRALPR